MEPQGVILDRQGNLFGAAFGGVNDAGNIFELTPRQGSWSFHVIHTFTGGPDGGSPPTGSEPAVDGLGNLYGTTISGGSYNYGTVYRLAPVGQGKWKETVLHAFTDGADGGNPYGGVVFGSSGSLLGTTLVGGASGEGVVFEIKP